MSCLRRIVGTPVSDHLKCQDLVVAFYEGWSHMKVVVLAPSLPIASSGQFIQPAPRRSWFDFWHILQPVQIKRTIPLMNLLFESLIRCEFQIHLCIPAGAISSEFTREVVMKFLPAQFSWIWCKWLQSNFVHSKIVQSDRIQGSYRKNSRLITHAGMQIWIWYWLRQRLTD